jgi:histone deacetylase 1/2
MDLLHGLGSSTNMASHGGGRGGGNGGRGHGHGDFNAPSGHGHGRSGGHNSNFEASVFCQICGKEGHPAVHCFKRFDTTFIGAQEKNKSASTTETSYGVDTNWYVNTGATDHITSELEKLTVRDKYHGNEQVHTTSGSGIKISYVGRSLFHTPDRNLILDKILHVPQANKNLASMHRLVANNNVYLEFYPDHFLIKDRDTKKVLHQG